MRSWRALVLVLALALMCGCAAPSNKPPSAVAPAATAGETKLTPQEIDMHDGRATAFLQQKDYRKALDEYQAVLRSDPDNPSRLYNMACAHSLLNEKEQAVACLKKAVAAGWGDFDTMQRDTDLDAIRDTAGYRELLEKRADIMRKLPEKRLKLALQSLAEKGVDTSQYKTEKDPIRPIIYLYNTRIPAAKFAATRKKLEGYADYQWKHLFSNPPTMPFCIVLLDMEDTTKMFRGTNMVGVFIPGTNSLLCGDVLWDAQDVILHEFTHLLHMNDAGALGYEPPIWFAEGLATLYGSSAQAGDSFRPRFNQSLTMLQNAMRAGQVVSWTALFRESPQAFMANDAINYPYVQYVFFYIHERGLLKKFYAEYSRRCPGFHDDSALAVQQAIESVFGKPMNAVERDWREWVLKQQLPPLPYLGVRVEMLSGMVTVTAVAPKAPAEKAGIRPGDQIRAIDGTEVANIPGFAEILQSKKIGDTIKLEIVRDARKQILKLPLEKRPETH